MKLGPLISGEASLPACLYFTKTWLGPAEISLVDAGKEDESDHLSFLPSPFLSVGQLRLRRQL